jgi:L-malate glycosyltransferase
MKILLLCYEYPPLGGGGGIGAQQYAEAWAHQGHDVLVVTSWAKTLRFEERINGVDIIRILTIGKKNRATTTFISMFSYITFGLFYILLHKQKFHDRNIINSHFSLPTGLLGISVSGVLGLPHVLTIIGGDIYDPSKRGSPHRNYLTRSINRIIMNSVERIVAISSDTKNRAVQLYHIQKNIEIINYGFSPIKPPKINQPPFNRENGKFYLIAVGRLIKRKGFEHLIASLNALPPNIVLYIIGDGPMESYLKRMTTENKLDRRVVFTGFKSREEIYGYMLNSDCFVLPSLHEGLGLVVQEAMSAGLPIVSTDNGGQVDLIRDGRNGILVEPHNSLMLASAINKIYLDKLLAQKMRENNKHDIKQYNISVKSNEYIGLFEQTMLEVNTLREKSRIRKVTGK